ncbi:hypothetical protein SAMN04489732_103487 [Amycolatopsis saalfeldensis]|uniref:Enoyl-(Acyl carrier protein) reductase n=1 Tax=Amycolatopsis saalfeldensis TaxID=394193 RepID=A0A1H8UVC3_9PSEU|nr:hypothetical protein SAMN04489732_103487 [Amycolatopsis saalfeldensis]
MSRPIPSPPEANRPGVSHGIAVTSVAPGFATAGQPPAGNGLPLRKQRPSGQVGTTGETAGAVLYLASAPAISATLDPAGASTPRACPPPRRSEGSR